jgi:hypothetical protein
MSVLLMQRYAIDNDIKASTELKKEEIIEYILSNAQETKETYYVPETEAYEMEIEQLSTEQQVTKGEDIVSEVKMSEPLIKVVTKVEETIQEEQPVFSQSALREIAKELRLLREAIERIEEKRTIHAAIERQEKVTESPIAPLAAKPFESKQPLPVEPEKTVEKQEKVKKQPKEKVQKVKKEKPPKKEKAPKKIKPPKKIKSPRRKKNFLKTLIKLIILVVVLYVLLYVGFSLITYLTNISFLDSIADRINRFNFLGKGTMDLLWDIYGSIGLPKA